MPGGESGIVVTSPDPTENVRQLVLAEGRRFDEAVASLRREAEMRSGHEAELRAAEAKRIDAIRAVDVAAVSVASERQAQAAQVLASQVSTSAETLRALVASTASAQAAAQGASNNQFSERLTVLEKSSNQGAGRSGVSERLTFAIIAGAVALGGALIGHFWR